MIELNNCYKSYDKDKTYVLKELSLKIDKGEMIAIIGDSGNGKTTLLNILGTLDQVSQGKYLFDNQNIARISSRDASKFRNKKIGFVFQQYYLIPYLSVFENIKIPLLYCKEDKEKKEANIDILLEKLNLKKLKDRNVRNLSGGEKQRVSIARALINEPELILADEPTGDLDEKNGEKVLTILKEINNTGVTVIIVTHNHYVAKQCKRVFELSDGKLHEITI